MNGLAFFISFSSLWMFLYLTAITKDINILIVIVSIILIMALLLTPLLYVAGIIILFTTGRTLVKKEGLSMAHVLSILFGSGIIASSFILPFFANRIKYKGLLALMGFFITVYSYFVIGFIIFLTSALIYNLWYEKKDKDYLIVLGAGLSGDKVTPLLASRIDRAIKFYNAQKERGAKAPKIIMSGGKGPDEIVSEALAMRNYAIENNVAEEDIIMEDMSTSTEENLVFSSKMIIEDSNNPNSKVLFITSNYHVLRAGILAKSLGLNYNGLGSSTKFYYYVSAIIREYIALINMNKKLNIKFAIIIGVISLLGYYLNY
ncbi:MAG: YdcF family protein [Epulopiscium sp.]|nr:YdcF family protein [Candidatus Epulonipiscium sp.]